MSTGAAGSTGTTAAATAATGADRLLRARGAGVAAGLVVVRVARFAGRFTGAGLLEARLAMSLFPRHEEVKISWQRRWNRPWTLAEPRRVLRVVVE